MKKLFFKDWEELMDDPELMVSQDRKVTAAYQGKWVSRDWKQFVFFVFFHHSKLMCNDFDTF